MTNFKPLLNKIHNAKSETEKQKAISHYKDVIDFRITEFYQPSKMYETDPEKQKEIQRNINYIKRLKAHDIKTLTQLSTIKENEKIKDGECLCYS